MLLKNDKCLFHCSLTGVEKNGSYKTNYIEKVDETKEIKLKSVRRKNRRRGCPPDSVNLAMRLK